MAWNPEYQHLAKSILLEETGSNFIVRAVVWFSILVMGAFVTWAWFAEIKEVAVATGEIVPTEHVQKVQHLEGGRIKEILVEDGSIVVAGQVMIKLDDLAARTEVAKISSGIDALMAQKIRLQAFVQGKKPDFSAQRITIKGASLDQKKIFEQAVMSKDANRETILNQMAALRSEKTEIRTRRVTLKNQIKLLREEVELRGTLLKKGLTSKPLMLTLQRQESELDGELKSIPSKLNRIDKRIAESKSRLKALDSDLTHETLKELADVNTNINKLTEEQKHLKQRLELTNIRAPRGGIAHGLKKHTVGAIVEPGQTIVEIVPMEGGLYAQVRIPPKDIGYIGVGQDVVMKFAAYEYARFGGLEGNLEVISATTFQGEDGQPYYKGIVPLSSAFMQGDGNKYPIFPGMTLDADIITGEKTVFEYLLKPIYQSARNALREK